VHVPCGRGSDGAARGRLRMGAAVAAWEGIGWLSDLHGWAVSAQAFEWGSWDGMG
jgi:hypothetical protein